MKKCEKCGADNTDTLAFCTNCGAPLLSSPTPAPAPAPVQAPTPAPMAPAAEVPAAPVMPETPVAPATPEAPVVPAPEPMPAPSAEAMAPATPAPSTIPTPTPVKPTAGVKPAGKNNKMLMIILIAAIAIIGVVIAVILVMSNSSSNTPAATTTNTPAANTAEVEESSAAIINSTTEGTNAIIGDYALVIPKVLNYNIKDDQIYLGDVSESWMAAISYAESVTYANVSKNLDAFATALEGDTLKVANKGADAISGQQYSYIDYTENEIMYSMGFFKAANDATFVAIVTNGTAVADHGLFGITTPIILSAKDAATVEKNAETVKTGNGLIKTMHLDDTSALKE